MKPKEPTDLVSDLGGDSTQYQEELQVESHLESAAVSDDIVTVQDIVVSAAEVRDACKADLNFLSALLMPTIFKFNFPPVFLAVWSWLLSFVFKERSFPKLALGLPRGFGKTTLIKIFVVFCILFTKRKFILITAHTAGLAANIIADIVDMLDEPNIKAVFGDWRLGIEKDTQDLKKFGFRGRNIILAGIGAGGSLRGLNLKNERPDVMIFEDIQSKEDADSEAVSKKLEDWMFGTAMKAKSPHGCMFLFIANMYPTKWSLLRRLKHNSTWTKFIAGGILADGTSLWEALQPIAQLFEEYEADCEAGKAEIFHSEVLNDENASQNTLIDISELPEIPYEEGDIPLGNFIIIDPSNDKTNSDAVSIGYFEVHDTKPILMHLTEDRLSPGDMIRVAIQYALTHNCRVIAVESNAYQYSALYWFNFIMQQLNITGIHCVEIYSGSRSKNSRILDFFKSYKAGEIFAHARTKTALHSQITGFNPLKRDNVDGVLDLMTYAPRMIAEFGEYIVIQNIIEQQELGDIIVPDFNSAF